MQVCKSCLYPLSHPLGLVTNEGVCSGCITHEEKYIIDWNERRALLEDHIKKYSKKCNSYDCVIPVVGDAEDYYTVSLVLELGLSPLLVCVNDYFKNDIGWYNLHNLITYFDVDSLIYNPDKSIYQELIRTSMRKFNHVLLPFLQLHTSFPVHVASDRKIPLVIWGQNQAVEQVGKFSHFDAVQMSKWSRKEHDLFGTDVECLIGNGAQVDVSHLNYYRYPKIENSKVLGLYLNHYFKWDPLLQNSKTLRFGFQPEEQSSTFDCYERAGSSVYYEIHDLLKFERHGYRKVLDHITREIRHKRISRKEGEGLYEGYANSPVDIKSFFDWLGVSNSGYEWYCHHRLEKSKRLLSGQGGDIKLPSSLSRLIECEMRKPYKKYIVFGKGV